MARLRSAPTAVLPAVLLAVVPLAVLLGGCGSGAPAAPPPTPPASTPRAPSPPAVPIPSSSTSAPPPSPVPPPPPPAGRKVTIQLTGYSFEDNTPPGSAKVCCSVLHTVAGGSGTYEDPITVAVPGGPASMALRRGTRFYLPTVRRYVIVEDSGASRYGLPHLDMWVDGRGGSSGSVESCMSAITARVPAELDPPPGRPVLAGPISADGHCQIP